MPSPSIVFERDLHHAAIAAVHELLPRFLSADPQDERREAQLHGGYSYSVNVVAYRGWMTASGIDFQNSKSSKEFLRVLGERHPELSSFGVSLEGSWSRQDGSSFLVTWLLDAAEAADAGKDVDDAIEQTVMRTERALSAKEAVLDVWIYLDGLTIQDDVRIMSLDRDHSIVALTPSQQRCVHATFQPPIPRPASTSTALVFNRRVPFTIGEENREPRVVRDEDFAVELAACLLSLTVLRAGQVAATHIDLIVKGLPGLGRLETRYLHHTARHRGLPLNAKDLPRLAKLFQRIRNENHQSALHRATARLYFSEERLSAGDALVDACIGLESVLLPRAHGEQSFRIAANYAFIGEEKERRSRYDRMEAMQLIRNDIVHGSSGKDHDLLSRAEEGRAMLRETLFYFLHEDRAGLERDKEYWLARLFGPKDSTS